MAGTTTQNTGSAAVQGDLWSANPRDWAEIQEGQSHALFVSILDRTSVGRGTRILDAGSGAGGASVLAAERGAVVSGIDAAPALIEIARTRLPGSDFRVGELEDLPYPDRTFDLVIGVNAFQYATDPVHALVEARRVTVPGGRVVLATWGSPEECEAAGYLKALGSVLPPPPPGAPGPFALSTPGALERLATEAGLTPDGAHDVLAVWEFPNRDTALRGLLSAGPAQRAIRAAGEDVVRERVSEAIAPYRTSSGAYRLENVFRYLIARA